VGRPREPATTGIRAGGDPRLLGREFEFARLLSYVRRRRIRSGATLYRVTLDADGSR
jgi:hypothetical protein